MKRSKKRPLFFYALLILALAVLFFLFVASIGRSWGGYALQLWNAMVVQGSPSYAYEQSLKNVLSKDAAPTAGEQIGEINCTEIGLRAPVYYGDTNEILEKGAGIYMGSYLPGEGGTVLMGAHDTTFFAPLEDIKVGDSIEIIINNQAYIYQAEKITVGESKDESMYELNMDKDELILYTCYPFGKISEVRSQRYYVYAKPKAALDENGE